MTTTTAGSVSSGPGVLRQLGPPDADLLLSLCAIQPSVDVFVASRARATGLDPWRLGGQVWGYEADGRLVSACYIGGNLVPVQATADAVVAFARHVLRSGRRTASLVGAAVSVQRLWHELEPAWGPARELRMRQPLLEMDGPPLLSADPHVRRTRLDDLDVLVPACEAMFVEEVGVRPYPPGGEAQYRESVAELVRSGRSYARFDRYGVVFKAEVGSVVPQVCQVQGVWVHPRLRGRGLAAPGMAAVVTMARHDHAPVVSLYVNDFNVAAVRAYERTGFHAVGVLATVLLP